MSVFLPLSTRTDASKDDRETYLQTFQQLVPSLGRLICASLSITTVGEGIHVRSRMYSSIVHELWQDVSAVGSWGS